MIVVNSRLEEIKEEITSSLKRQWSDVLTIGRLAVEAKGLLPHGQFTKWIDSELKVSDRLIRSYMRFFQRFGNSEMSSAIPITAGILLASPSVPEGAIAEVQRRLIDGESFTVEGVESIIDKYRVLQSAHIGGQAVLTEYGMKDGEPTKKINRSDITSLVAVTGEALERGVVHIEGEDHPVPDIQPGAVLKPIPDLPNVPILTIPNTVKAAVKSASAQRQSDHIEANNPIMTRTRATVAGMVINGFVTLKLSEPEMAERLSKGQIVTIEF